MISLLLSLSIPMRVCGDKRRHAIFYNLHSLPLPCQWYSPLCNLSLPANDGKLTILYQAESIIHAQIPILITNKNYIIQLTFIHIHHLRSSYPASQIPNQEKQKRKNRVQVVFGTFFFLFCSTTTISTTINSPRSRHQYTTHISLSALISS